MVSPWDAQRRRPDDWKVDEDVSTAESDSQESPRFDESSDFLTPSLEIGLPDFGLPPDPGLPDFKLPPNPGEPEAPRDEKKNLGGRNRASSQGRSIQLFAVTLTVAALVFLGLRVVRVSFSNNSSATSPVDSPSATETTNVFLESVVSTTIAATEKPPGSSVLGEVDWNELARSVVHIRAGGNCQWVGSGTLILDGSYVLTNWHVSGGGECSLRVGLTESPSAPPSEFYSATVVLWDTQIDLAVVRLQNASGAPYVPPGRKPVSLATKEVRLGDAVKLLGYPVVREELFSEGYTLTLTDGSVSGIEDFGESGSYKPIDARGDDYQVWGEYIKHTAIQNGGVSGGGAFNSAGELVAIPTAGDEKLELMRSVRFAKILIEKISK